MAVNFKQRKETKQIIVHCSATPPSMFVDAAKIRSWHLNRGWSDIGYHCVILRSGKIEDGRPQTAIGAHVKGHNHDSIGICLVGGVDENNKPDANFTYEQYVALKHELSHLMDFSFENVKIVNGHRDFAAKACPSFDIHGFLENYTNDKGEVVESLRKELI